MTFTPEDDFFDPALAPPAPESVPELAPTPTPAPASAAAPQHGAGVERPDAVAFPPLPPLTPSRPTRSPGQRAFISFAAGLAGFAVVAVLAFVLNSL